MELHNKIAEISLKQFSSLPKTGKPNNKEWTVMSTIVLYDSNTHNLEVVSLGTGSKCIGAYSMSPDGDILNDSHAEIICRRAFLKYIYTEIENFIKHKKSDIFFEYKDDKLVLKNSLSFHLFSTHAPCGDAAIFPKQDSEDFGECLQEKECSKNLEENNEVPNKKVKFDPDIFRTGAKCLNKDIKQDPKKSGQEYHVTGVIRTKPGRGDPTLSVSCSDKILKWTFVGIQGALLSILLEKPIYLSSVTIAGNVPFAIDAMNRALCTRFTAELSIPYKQTPPSIKQSDFDFSFEFCKSDSKQPCPSSIIWFKNCQKVEVAVEGKKQGVTKKNKNKKAGRLSICKKELFSTFCDITNSSNMFKCVSNSADENYLDVKNKAYDYIKVWNDIKCNVFKIWTYKNANLLRFVYHDS